MKIRNLLIVVAMLSVLLCGAIGTAYAVLAVGDDVAGTDLVIPFICGRTDLDASNTLNTLYTIAEVKGLGAAGTNWVVTDRVLYNQNSLSIVDYPTNFTSHDLLSFNCNEDFYGNELKGIPGHSVPTMDFYTITIPASGGKKYLAGYIILSQLSANDGFCSGTGVPSGETPYCTSTLDCLQYGITTVCDKTTLQNRFVGWEYLVDLYKGFASGFNAVSIENGVGQNLGEDGGNAAITAATFWPRIYVHNALSQTWNWWIVLAGRNEYSCGGVAPAPGRFLKGYICSPEEVCPSFSIHIPKELNIIDMMTEVPQVSSIPGWPKSAFAIANVEEKYSQSGNITTITGTVNTDVCSEDKAEAYSMFGWSYQRAQSDTPIGGFNGSWDVVHPFHRNYCSGAGVDGTTYDYVVGTECQAGD